MQDTRSNVAAGPPSDSDSNRRFSQINWSPVIHDNVDLVIVHSILKSLKIC